MERSRLITKTVVKEVLKGFYNTHLIFTTNGLNALMLWHLQQEKELYTTLANNMQHRHYVLARPKSPFYIPPHVTVDEQRNGKSNNPFSLVLEYHDSINSPNEIWFDNEKPRFKWLTRLFGKFYGIRIEWPLEKMTKQHKIDFLTTTALLPPEIISSVLGEDIL